MKRHERLHIRDRSPSLKRKASGPLSESPPSLQVGLYATQPHMMHMYSKSQGLDAKGPISSAPSGLPGPCLDTSVGLSHSPSFLNVQDPAITPLSVNEFNTLPFDFDIAALNQFLTSGDFDALISQTQQDLPQASDVSTTPAPRLYPRPSNAIKAAWFTNMEEKDLENEATMMRSTLYKQENHRATVRPDYPNNDNHGSEHIDEAWRQKANSSLVPQVMDLGPLPSIEFLVCHCHFPLTS